MSPPPPPGAIASFVAQIHQQTAAATAEADERRRLRNEIERRKLELELARLNSPAPQARRPIDTYEQQITEWFNQLPPEARKAPRTMEEFINILEGRTTGMRAHPGEVSRVLRRMRWVRRRCWKSDGEGHRIWLPPR
jgi:hypothetical protein